MRRLTTLGMVLTLLFAVSCSEDKTVSGSDSEVLDATGDVDTSTSCTIDCDCPQGEACASGRCVALLEPVYCCDKAGCVQGEACVDGAGRVSSCPACVVDCDCPQGEACVLGECAQADEPVFCCDNPGCPPGQACTDVSGQAGSCEKECEVDCDCPQGEICSASGLCLATAEPTYCCENDGCPLGETCFERDGTESSCTECKVDCDCEQGSICTASGLCRATAEPVFCCDNAGCPGGEACTGRDGSAGVCEGNSGPECGNGEVEAGETCDGDCPTTVSDCPSDACSIPRLSGSPAACTSECYTEPVVSCTDDDGCCPEGCIAATDNDCEGSVCGNGIAEEGETCDGNCPDTCDAPSACFEAAFTGTADDCNLRCVVSAIEVCADGDGCCPDGCTNDTDNDCPALELCGNGTLDNGETCDDSSGTACPTSCTAPNSCSTSRLIGSGCTRECVDAAITECVNGDGCCASGCSFANDNDCTCQAESCADRGYACGSFSTCGNVVTCTSCPSGQRCVDFACVDSGEGPIGAACESDADCDSGLFCNEEEFGWPGGLCTRSCDGLFNTCPSGNTCANERCRPTCTDDSNCREDYACAGAEGSKYCQIDAGSGTGDVGDPCTTSVDCAGGDAGFCALEYFGWRDGYCSLDCTTDDDCTSGSHCGRKDENGDGICLLDCNRNGDCRSDGYLCFDVDATSPTECHAAATGSGALGAPCDGAWECAGGADGFCLTEARSGWPDGFCTLDCQTSSDCGSGFHCGFVENGDGVCMKTCSSDGQCTRDGYTCENADEDTGNLRECFPEGSTPGNGNGATGSACNSSSDCAGDTCLTDWPGGYCSSTCISPIQPCITAGDVCGDPTGAGGGFGTNCLKPCSTNADCRVGYTCNTYTDLFGIPQKACGYTP